MFGNPTLDNTTDEANFESVYEYIKLSKNSNLINKSLANHIVTYMYFLEPVSGTSYIHLF